MRNPVPRAPQAGAVQVCAVAALALAAACAPLDPWAVDRAAATRAFKAGDYQTAEAVMEAALIRAESHGPADPRVATSLDELGSIHYRQGRWDEAERLWREALALMTQAGSTRSVEYASVANNLGHLLVETGRYDEAEDLHKAALVIRQDRFGYNSAPVAQTLNNLSVLTLRAGRIAAAAEYARKAREVAWFARGFDHAYVVASINNQAAVAEAQGDLSEAFTLYREALRRNAGRSDEQAAATLNNIGQLELRTGRPSIAIGHLEQALAIYRSALPADHPHVRQVAINLAEVHRAVGDHGTAESILSAALASGLETPATR